MWIELNFVKWLLVYAGLLCIKQFFENVTAGHNSTLPLSCEECELGVTASADCSCPQLVQGHIVWHALHVLWEHIWQKTHITL